MVCWLLLNGVDSNVLSPSWQVSIMAVSEIVALQVLVVVIFVKELIHVIISGASQRLPLYGPNTCNLWEGVYLPTRVILF